MKFLKKIFTLVFISVGCLNGSELSDKDFVDTLTKARIIGKLKKGTLLSVDEKKFYSTQMLPVKPQEAPLARPAGKKHLSFNS